MQATREKCEVDQHEVDAKVRGKLLAHEAVAEVQHRVMCQVDKARLAAEKLQVEREASWSLWKVQMRLGVSFFPFLFIGLRLRRVAGYLCTCECGGGLIEVQGE